MFDVMSYADRNDVEVSIRKGHELNLTEFTRIIDIEIRGRMDQDAYIEFRCEQLMDMIRSARMKKEFSDIESKNDETALQPEAAGQFFLFSHIPMR